MSTDTTNAAAVAVKTPSITVRMDDGRDVEFAGKRKMIKSHTIAGADEPNAGEVVVRIDFVNGETRTYNIVATLLHKFAAHGAEQKLGDEIAGVVDVEDCVVAIDALLIRLEQGEWNATRDTNGMAGASILCKALIEMTGKSKADVMLFLSNKTHAQKIALRGNPKLDPIVKRLEAEKAARSTKVKANPIDSDALLNGLGVSPATAGEAEVQDELAEAGAAE